MSAIQIDSTDKAIAAYYQRLDALKKGLKLTSEGSTRRAFGALLDDTSRVRKWTLAEEVTQQRKNHRIRLDGVLYGQGNLPHGYWEAKDTKDNLSEEILKKSAKEYPVGNIIFEDTERAILIQDNVQVEDITLRNADDLARLLTRFYNHEMEPFQEFEKAIEWFAQILPDMGADLQQKIAESHKTNKKFQTQFAEFMALCQQSLNPNISEAAVDEMLIQHLLTERLIRNIFQPNFTRRNIIAHKVEDVIDALTSKLFDRTEFQKSLDPFYIAIENAANSLAEDYTAKQTFINTVYEQFFQGYSVKTADTHGIVYTPPEIVDFMCAAVEEVLETEFGKKLGHEGVAVLDPCVGTGNFIINLLNRVNPKYRRDFYKKHLFANEVMLMPYYIASLNIENEYYQAEGEYEPFEGLAFVDTLDLAKKRQLSFDFMTEKNSQRVQRQQETDITVIIGNPPYNVGQLNENDNNKNRKYDVIDQRISETYAKDSTASLKTKLYDAYVKFFRWATDRLEDRDGIVCFVTNNNFVEQNSFDGMRKHLMQDFNRIYHLDLHGNVRQNPKLSGTTHNVFGIQVGVGITIAIRSKQYEGCELFYYRVPEFARKEQKLRFLVANVEVDGKRNSLNTVGWEQLAPEKLAWIVPEFTKEFMSYIPVGNKKTKSSKKDQTIAIFDTYSLGVSTNRDRTVYSFEADKLDQRMVSFVESYNMQVDRYVRAGSPKKLTEFTRSPEVDWSHMLKQQLKRGNHAEHNTSKIRLAQYRPFAKRFLYFDKLAVDATSLQPYIFPNGTVDENMVISLTGTSPEKPFMTIMTNITPDLHLVGAGAGAQTFPFYVYDENPTPSPSPLRKEGSYTRRENITDWALGQFRAQYGDESITKWDIFYYVYGLLHHPEYRARYADNLKRELPRIPFVPKVVPIPQPTDTQKGVPTVGTAFLPSAPNKQNSGFWAFSEAGKKLAEMHLNYEAHARSDDIEWVPNEEMQATYRVEKMKPKKKRKVALSSITSGTDSEAEVSIYDTLEYNAYLTLTGIPEKAFAYRLGNRSALDWIVDQYWVKTDKHSGIVRDPNGYSEDDQYIVKLVERVVQLSVETVEIVEGLAQLPFRTE